MGDRLAQLPETVRRKAHRLGRVGTRWLDELDAIVAGLADEWGLTVGPALGGGTSSFAAFATADDGADVVLKIAPPDGFEGVASFANEIVNLSVADGRGYARLIAHDVDRRALLLERLGRSLHLLGLSADAQIAIICSTLREAWVPVDADTCVPTGAAKARWLSEFIIAAWDELGHPCSVAVVEQAVSFAEARGRAFDPERSVLVHGDAHSANTLEDPDARSGGSGFKFVDPDGLFAERAYDLAIPMREFNDELLAGDAFALGQERCRYLGALTGVDQRAIWEWGFVERVSTGLYVTQVGSERWGREFLDIAEHWVAKNP